MDAPPPARVNRKITRGIIFFIHTFIFKILDEMKCLMFIVIKNVFKLCATIKTKQKMERLPSLMMKNDLLCNVLEMSNSKNDTDRAN
jgi:hypothetical protein